MLAWLAPILVLGIVIFVHELGHFLAAKWAGVYAPRFSLGWGKPLWSFRRGETEYALSWLPIGGYVRMASKEDETASVLEGGSEAVPEGERPKDWDPEAMVPFGPKPVPADRWFESKSLVARLVILVAGVVMNVILALVVSTGVFAYYGRGYLPAVADSVVAGKPAALAGMQRGDSIVSIDGRAVTRWTEVVAAVSAAPERAITLGIVRGGTPMSLTVTPEAQEVAGPPDGALQRVGRIGVAPAAKPVRERMGLAESVRSGGEATWGMATSVVTVLRGLLSGNVSVSQLGGPVEIARSSVQAAESGLESVWALIAFLSINLAVLNLLPIPLLDGGQILFQLAEGAWRKPFHPMVREWYARVGLLAIGLLFVTVMFNDLKRLVTGWMGG